MNIIYLTTIFLYCIVHIECTCKRGPGKTYGNTNTNLKNIAKDKKLLAVVEASFLKFMGLSKKPNKHLKKKVKVPAHLWKIYRKWSNDDYDDNDKKNSDTARVVYHSGKFN